MLKFTIDMNLIEEARAPVISVLGNSNVGESSGRNYFLCSEAVILVFANCTAYFELSLYRMEPNSRYPITVFVIVATLGQVNDIVPFGANSE